MKEIKCVYLIKFLKTYVWRVTLVWSEELNSGKVQIVRCRRMDRKD